MSDSTGTVTATKSILVVEDDELNMKLFRTILTLDGYGVVQAFNAERALELVEERLPDLIVMDVQLPGMDGTVAVKILKATEKTWLIPVVAVTGYAMKEDQERCLGSLDAEAALAKECGVALQRLVSVGVLELVNIPSVRCGGLRRCAGQRGTAIREDLEVV